MGRDRALFEMRKKSVSFQPHDYIVTDESPSLEPQDVLETYEDNSDPKFSIKKIKNNLDKARNLKIVKTDSEKYKNSLMANNLNLKGS